jgi:hypothetical protein
MFGTALMAALLIGFLSIVSADQRGGFINRDQTTAYAAAHAGLEQLTSDMGELFATNYRPMSTQVTALSSNQPAMGDISFHMPGGGSGYQIMFDDVAPADGFPDTEAAPRTISSGPYQGLMGTVTPYGLWVTAQTASGAETRMRRTMETVLIPAFQFGIYSDNDLTFHAGPSFDFGGRVHTNGNLYLAEGTGNTLWLRDRITAVGEVIRKNMVNGWLTSSGYAGTVKIARYTGDTTGATMAMTDQSWSGAAGQVPPPPVEGVTPSPGSNDPAWTTFSTSTASGAIKNGRTGARPLVLPLVQMGAAPIDLIRRPVVNSNEDTASPEIFGQRYFARASLRILLSDTAADIMNLPGVTQAVQPVDLSTLNLAGLGPTAQAPPHPSGCWSTSQNKYVVCGNNGTTANPAAGTYAPQTGAWQVANQPLITGFIKIEMQRQDFTWVDVTNEILQRGYTGMRLSNSSPANNWVTGLAYNAAGYYLNDTVWSTAPAAALPAGCAEPHPDAIIRIQRIRDDHAPNSTTCGNTTPAQAFPRAIDLIPNVLFDPREGNLRGGIALTTAFAYMGGVMHYVELDIRNIARWFAGQIGASGNQAEFTDGGYVVYFSDRRTNQRINARETGEYGAEDFVNPNDATNGFPNGSLDAGEDVNGIDIENNGNNLDTYGAVAAVLPSQRAGAVATGAANVVINNAAPRHGASTREARSNPPLFFRRALKLVRGAGTAGNAAVSPLTVLAAGRGLTVVAENPVYVQGNFNTGTGATNFGTAQTDHRPSAVIADSVTLLSNNWNDLRSFRYTDTGGVIRYGSQDLTRRNASETWYRMAVASGKSLNFPHPAWETQDESFGDDGGAHNFLRYIENWLSPSVTVHYKGSLLSFYNSRQAIGTFKYNNNTYGAPVRDFKFDTEFLQLSLLPPKSPAFRDVNTLTFREVLRPTQ